MCSTFYCASLGKLPVCCQLRNYWVAPLRWVGINLNVAYPRMKRRKYLYTLHIYSCRILQMFPDVLWHRMKTGEDRRNRTNTNETQNATVEDKKKKKEIRLERMIFPVSQSTLKAAKCNNSRSTEHHLSFVTRRPT